MKTHARCATKLIDGPVMPPAASALDPQESGEDRIDTHLNGTACGVP